MLWRDLLRCPELLRHRAVLLLNLFRLDDAEVAFLRERLLADGRLVAMVGPVGLVVTLQGVDPNRTAQVLGFATALSPVALPLQATFAGGLPAPWQGLSDLTFGTPQPYPSVVLPSETGAAQVLGTLVPGGQPAVLFSEERNARLFWSAAPGLPPALLRTLADIAGVPVVCRTDDAIYAGHGFIGIHASQAGTKTVRLPHPGRVLDLISGQHWPAGTTELTVDMAPGETAILQTGK